MLDQWWCQFLILFMIVAVPVLTICFIVSGMTASLVTADAVYLPIIANLSSFSGAPSHIQVLAPGRATFTAFIYQDEWHTLNTTTLPGGALLTSYVDFLGWDGGPPPNLPFSCRYSVYSSVTAVSDWRISPIEQWFAGGTRQSYLAPGCSSFTAYRIALILLLIFCVPFAVLPPLVFCRARSLRTEAERFTAVHRPQLPPQPPAEGETIDVEGPPMPEPEPDKERLPRVWTAAVVFHGWVFVWLLVAVVQLKHWLGADEWAALNAETQLQPPAMYGIAGAICGLMVVQLGIITWDVRRALLAMKVNDPLVFTAPLGCKGACTAERRQARRRRVDPEARNAMEQHLLCEF